MRDACMTELADVNETFDSAEIDEGAEVAHRRQTARQHGSDLDALPGARRFLRRFLVEEDASRHDDVAPPGLDLGHAERQALAHVARGIPAPPVDLRSGTEGAYGSDLYVEAALVLA